MSATMQREGQAPAVDPRFAERRRSVEGARRRRRRHRLLAVLVAVVVLAGGYLLTRTALLDVDAIAVEGAVHETNEQVVEASGLRPGDQLLDVDEGAVAERVRSSLPWVDAVSVGVGLDGVVTLTVTERTAVATAVDGSGGRVLLDASGRVLAPAGDDVAGLVPVGGVTAGAPGETLDGAEGALAAMAALGPGVRSRVTGAAVAPDGSLLLTLNPEGVVVLGPPDDLEAKAVSLATVMGQVEQRGLKSVDVRDPGNPVVVRNQG